jgi:hypothetical protein
MTRQSSTPAAGWILRADWEPAEGGPPVLFQASWRVPDQPGQNDDQLIYLFHGLRVPGKIAQCVLQWGDAGTYGGPRWYAVCMYADSEGQHSLGNPVSVSPGKILNAEIRLSGQDGGYIYTLQFTNVSHTALQVRTTVPLTACCIALEVYDVVTAQDYPVSNSMRFENINIATTGGNVLPFWSLTNNAMYGENILQDDSRVVISFRGQPLFV